MGQLPVLPDFAGVWRGAWKKRRRLPFLPFFAAVHAWERRREAMSIADLPESGIAVVGHEGAGV
jgi:hypothetical protein